MIVHRLNGEPADVAGLGRALVNYGHFTSMQVRGGAVRGLRLHLQRLDAGTRELFDQDLDLDRVRCWMAAAAQGMPAGDGSLRVLVFPRTFDLRDPGRELAPEVLVSASPAAVPGAAPLRVRSHAWLRPLPHIKHVATFPLLDAMRRARRAGYDDAVLVSAAGQVVEGSVWNIVFEDVAGFVWPEGPMLDGVTARLMRGQIDRADLPQRTTVTTLADLARFRAAYALSAVGVRAIASIDDCGFIDSVAGLPRLRALLDGVPRDALTGAAGRAAS